MPPSLFTANDTSAKSAYIESAKSFYTKGVCASNTYVKGTFAKNAFSAISACIKGVFVKTACNNGICTKVIYPKNVSAVKHLKRTCNLFKSW